MFIRSMTEQDRPVQCRLSRSSVSPGRHPQRAVVVDVIRQTSLQFSVLHTPRSLAVYTNAQHHRITLSLLTSAGQTQRTA